MLGSFIFWMTRRGFTPSWHAHAYVCVQCVSAPWLLSSFAPWFFLCSLETDCLTTNSRYSTIYRPHRHVATHNGVDDNRPGAPRYQINWAFFPLSHSRYLHFFFVPNLTNSIIRAITVLIVSLCTRLHLDTISGDGLYFWPLHKLMQAIGPTLCHFVCLLLYMYNILLCVSSWDWWNYLSKRLYVIYTQTSFILYYESLCDI